MYNDEGLTVASTFLRTAGNAQEAAGGASSAAGNYYLGVAGFGGTPLEYNQLPPGAPIAGSLSASARIMLALADITNTSAGLGLTEAGWQRRYDEWVHQTDILKIELQQIERQILATQRRRDQFIHDLNSHHRQMEQSQEIQDFLRDKFTAHDLYLYLQKETFGLFSKTYDLALYATRQSQYAFNLERGHTTRNFIPDCAWDNLHEGLMAGERLSTALRHMEKAYLDQNVREYELTKHFSLRLHFPAAFLRLRMTGYCEIEIPEWMFDLDFPGHYMRRIKNVLITIPCVTGPYTGVHCRLTLLNSSTRIDPRLRAPQHECCCPPKPGCSDCCEEERLGREYLSCPDDPRIVRQFGAREAVATSTGQNDSGLFQLDFNDPRYLPFEYMGAISRWRIELPPENNFFDRDTVTDVVLRLGILAWEGGDPLRRAARAAAQKRLPGDGWSFFDIRHEFTDAWELFRRSFRSERRDREMLLHLSRNLFPFLPSDPEIRITKIVLLFQAECDSDTCCQNIEACPCPEEKIASSHSVKFMTYQDEDECCCEERSFMCYRSDEWPGLYIGEIAAELHHFHRGGGSRKIKFKFPERAGEIERAYLFCHYDAKGRNLDPFCHENTRQHGNNDDCEDAEKIRLHIKEFKDSCGGHPSNANHTKK